MVNFSQIDKELSIYRNRKIFLYGSGVKGGETMHILKAFNISIDSFVDSNPAKCGGRKFGIPIISFDELKQRARDDSTCIVQISCENEYDIIKNLVAESIRFITFEEFYLRTESLGKYILMKEGNFNSIIYENTYDRDRNYINREIIQYYSKNITEKSSNCNFIASMPKSGNASLHSTYSGTAMYIGHTFGYLNNDIIENMKKNNVNILCGVRDIISQRLSNCYQSISLYWDMEEFWHDGGDVEAIFNRLYVTKQIDGESEYARSIKQFGYDLGGPEFFDKQIKKYWDIDVYEYPFDKDAGYTVINKDNVHVFIYQLEKMDKLERQISNFLGCGEDVKLQRGNEASHKWYHDSYKKAQKEIKFSREYFDECYEGKYMKHFYNDEDIERFKQKWIGNVRNQK